MRARKLLLMPINKIKLRYLILLIIGLSSVIYFLFPFQEPLFANNYGSLIKSNDGQILEAFINEQEQWHFPPTQDSIPHKLEQAVIHFEDENFHHHIGVDFKAIIRAAIGNLKAGKIISGASTIHMQVARMRNPKPRTFINKLKESLDAIRIYLHFSDEEVLKAYLQHAPYGGNVIGYETASYKFFDKSPKQLTWGEAATLAIMPNAPGMIYPGKTSVQLKAKRNRLLNKLYRKNVITEYTNKLASIEPIPTKFYSFQKPAPHLARYLQKQYPDKQLIETTIDLSIQKLANQIASRYQTILGAYDIHNLSILIADTKTGAIKAYVGSSEFFDKFHNGQVDGVQAVRSSGSILKPFLYALAMEEGLILPNTLIRDLPTYFDGFSPSNANDKYAGVITAEQALIQSLNIPAVRLLNAYGYFQFYQFLKYAGISSLFRNADDYGLPIILGGAEVSLWEMIPIYRALANEGRYTPNTLLLKNELKEPKKLFSSGASYLTLEMISNLVRPGAEHYWQKFNQQEKIAWKTGTSFGHKDAWAMGVNSQYTIGVWAGNFTGESNKNLSGASSAGPILFDLFQSLNRENKNNWFDYNEMDFKEKKICTLSGLSASNSCPEVQMQLVPIEMNSMKICNYHKKVYLSNNLQFQVCSSCWSKYGKIEQDLLIYPPDIAYYLRLNGQYVDNIKPHAPDCSNYVSANSTKIIYPNLSSKLFLPRDYDGTLQAVICKLATNKAVEEVYWYLNDIYLGSTTDKHQMAIKFKKGENTLKVIDNIGGEDSHTIFATFQ